MLFPNSITLTVSGEHILGRHHSTHYTCEEKKFSWYLENEINASSSHLSFKFWAVSSPSDRSFFFWSLWLNPSPSCLFTRGPAVWCLIWWKFRCVRWVKFEGQSHCYLLALPRGLGLKAQKVCVRRAALPALHSASWGQTFIPKQMQCSCKWNPNYKTRAACPNSYSLSLSPSCMSFYLRLVILGELLAVGSHQRLAFRYLETSLHFLWSRSVRIATIGRTLLGVPAWFCTSPDSFIHIFVTVPILAQNQ